MSATATSQQPITLEVMRGSKRRHRKERAVRTFFQAAALLGLVISIAIVLALIEEAIRWLFDIQLGWLWTGGWIPRCSRPASEARHTGRRSARVRAIWW